MIIQKGSITYDGIDIKLIKKDDLRRSLGVVLQDTHLFTGTVMDNIRYGRLMLRMKNVLKQQNLPMPISLLNICQMVIKQCLQEMGRTYRKDKDSY